MIICHGWEYYDYTFMFMFPLGKGNIKSFINNFVNTLN